MSIDTIASSTEFDAIVVGSGLTGGWAAKELTEKGLQVLVLERGRDVEPGKDYLGEHAPDWKLPYQGKKPRELYEEEFSDAIVLPTRLAIDIPTEGDEGQKDVVTVSAVSTDNGQTYKGKYSYKGNSYPPGEVEFSRITSEDGYDIFYR